MRKTRKSDEAMFSTKPTYDIQEPVLSANLPNFFKLPHPILSQRYIFVC